ATSPLAQIKGYIASAYNGGSWNGAGLTSSAAATAAATSGAVRTALGYAEATDLFTTFNTTFSGQSFDSTSILIRYTAAGDSNLNGTVDLNDFTALASNFNGIGRRWFQGDYNYDSTVDLSDFTLLASNFN